MKSKFKVLHVSNGFLTIRELLSISHEIHAWCICVLVTLCWLVIRCRYLNTDRVRFSIVYTVLDNLVLLYQFNLMKTKLYYNRNAESQILKTIRTISLTLT